MDIKGLFTNFDINSDIDICTFRDLQKTESKVAAIKNGKLILKIREEKYTLCIMNRLNGSGKTSTTMQLSD